MGTKDLKGSCHFYVDVRLQRTGVKGFGERVRGAAFFYVCGQKRVYLFRQDTSMVVVRCTVSEKR